MSSPEFDPDRLAPEVRTLFRKMSKSGMPALETLPIDQMRTAYAQVGQLLGGDPVPVASVRDLAATGPLGDIPLRIYYPEESEEARPTVIYLHGGGWSTGSIETHDRVTRRLAHVSGFNVISVEYRLAPEYPAPAGPEDVLSAIRWIADHGVEFNIDAFRLAIAGDSAGGSLAAVATQRLRGEVSLLAQVLFYPATDLSPESNNFPSRKENANIPPLTIKAMEAFANPFIGDFNSRDTRLSPLLAKDLTALPPALIFSGECDVLLDDGRYYSDALKKAGNEVDFVEVPGMVHGFIEMAGELPQTIKAFEHAGVFLRNKLLA